MIAAVMVLIVMIMCEDLYEFLYTAAPLILHRDNIAVLAVIIAHGIRFVKQTAQVPNLSC